MEENQCENDGNRPRPKEYSSTTNPKSKFFGFDYHDKSIERAKERAKEAGGGDRIEFNLRLRRQKDYPGADYDFVTFFDCLHDMGHPVGVSTHVHRSPNTKGVCRVFRRRHIRIPTISE